MKISNLLSLCLISASTIAVTTSAADSPDITNVHQEALAERSEWKHLLDELIGDKRSGSLSPSSQELPRSIPNDHLKPEQSSVSISKPIEDEGGVGATREIEKRKGGEDGDDGDEGGRPIGGGGSGGGDGVHPNGAAITSIWGGCIALSLLGGYIAQFML